jgi:hypothetical protein
MQIKNSFSIKVKTMLGKRKRLATILEEDDEIIAGLAEEGYFSIRDDPYHRDRWDERKLWNRATNEDSFEGEYRLKPNEFNILHDILRDDLTVNTQMEKLATSRSGSSPISTMMSIFNDVNFSLPPDLLLYYLL